MATLDVLNSVFHGSIDVLHIVRHKSTVCEHKQGLLTMPKLVAVTNQGRHNTRVSLGHCVVQHVTVRLVHADTEMSCESHCHRSYADRAQRSHTFPYQRFLRDIFQDLEHADEPERLLAVPHHHFVVEESLCEGSRRLADSVAVLLYDGALLGLLDEGLTSASCVSRICVQHQQDVFAALHASHKLFHYDVPRIEDALSQNQQKDISLEAECRQVVRVFEVFKVNVLEKHNVFGRQFQRKIDNCGLILSAPLRVAQEGMHIVALLPVQREWFA